MISDDLGRLQITPEDYDSDSGRLKGLWTTLDDSDSGQLQAIPDDFRRFQTAPDAGWTYLPELVPKFFESDRSRLRIFANFTHH